MLDNFINTAKILIVDDNVSNVDILECLLEELGNTNFKSTTDPREVNFLFESFGPDLILLDLQMPYLDGFEVMDGLKNIVQPGTYLPILVLTADITEEARLRALSGGAKDFLSKPYNMAELRLRINNLLETRYLHLILAAQNQILEEKVKERTEMLEQAISALDIANGELEVLDKAKSGFLSLISHEIRTPLNGIIGFAGLLRDEIDSPQLIDYLDYLEKSAQRLEAFSYQALLITELRSKKRIIRNEITHPDELLTSAKTRFRDKIQANDITLHLSNDQSVNAIRGDSELIQICFDQLIDNAVKFSQKHSSVLIKINSSNHSVICEFIDTGTGFPANVLNNPYRIFGVDDRHVDGNTGLNLALIRLIMEAHHGTIEIGNNEIQGGKVILTFNNQP